jgi:outer membrane protein TolC
LAPILADCDLQFNRFPRICKSGENLNVNYTSTIALNIPIFSGFSTLNNLKEARAKKTQAEAELRQNQLTVIQDVVTSHTSVKSAFDALQFSDRLLETAKTQYEVILSRYKAALQLS